MSEGSRFRRFLSPVNRLDEGMLRYLTEVDHRDHEALVAIDPWSGHGVGRFSALVPETNREMLDLLHRIGSVEVRDREEGAVELEAKLPAAGPGDHVKELLRRAAQREATVAPAR